MGETTKPGLGDAGLGMQDAERLTECYCDHAPDGHMICLECGDDADDCQCERSEFPVTRHEEVGK
jgi:hypothetical protein